MKILTIGLILFLVVSCRETTGIDVYIFNNTTYHTIDLVFYESLDTKTIKEYTTVSIDRRSTDNSIFTTGLGNATSIAYTYDSVLVTYDDTVHITHHSKIGQPADPTANQILDFSSWIFIEKVEESRKEVKRKLLFTFTEEDYLKAL